MNDLVAYGVSNVHFAKVTFTDDGTPVFGAVYPLPGCVSISLPATGTPHVTYADNVQYFVMPVNQGYGGTAEFKSLTEQFRTDHLGEIKDANGVSVEKSDAVPASFALLGQFEGVDGQKIPNPKRFILFNCVATRPDLSGATLTDNFDTKTFSLSITASPIPSTKLVKATIRQNDNIDVYEAWFGSVYYNPSNLATQKVTVTVTDGVNPVAGAVVVLGKNISITSSTGKATFAVPYGTYDLLVSADGYTPETDTVTVSTSAVSNTVILTEA